MSVKELENSVNNFSQYYYPHEERTIKSSFYPLSFLRYLSELENKRREVVKQPSLKNITEHNVLLQKTIQIYQDNLQQLKTIYNNQTYKNTTFNYPTGKTTINSYKIFLDKLRNTARGVDIKRKNRYACLKGNIQKCPLLKNSLTLNFTPTKQNKVYPKKVYKVPEYIQEHRHINYAHFPIDVYEENIRMYYRNVPVVALTKSTCSPVDALSYYSVVPRESLPGVPVAIPVFLNDVYFYDFDSNHPLYQVRMLKRENLFSLLYQPLMTTYFCPNYGLDFAKIMTIIKVRSLLEEYPLFPKIEYQKLSKLKKNITSYPIVYEDDIVQFLNNLAYLLENRKLGLQTGLDNNDILFIEHLLLLYQTKTAEFDQLLLALVGGNNFLPLFTALGVKVSFDDLFLTRTVPILTYLTFNKSITKNTPIIVTNKKNNLSAFSLLSYQKDLKELYPPEKLIEIIQKSDLFYFKIPRF